MISVSVMGVDNRHTYSLESIGLPIAVGIRLASLMEPWAKRLHDLIEAGADRGLSVAGLVRATRAKQPSVFQWFKAPPGKKCTKAIGAVLAVRAANYVGTTVEYLITGRDRHESQPARPDDETIAQAVQLLNLIADARPRDKRFARITWPHILTAAKAIERTDSQGRAVAEILAEVERLG